MDTTPVGMTNSNRVIEQIERYIDDIEVYQLEVNWNEICATVPALRGKDWDILKAAICLSFSSKLPKNSRSFNQWSNSGAAWRIIGEGMICRNDSYLDVGLEQQNGKTSFLLSKHTLRATGVPSGRIAVDETSACRGCRCVTNVLDDPRLAPRLQKRARELLFTSTPILRAISLI
jgi:hypothetical protein